MVRHSRVHETDGILASLAAALLKFAKQSTKGTIVRVPGDSLGLGGTRVLFDGLAKYASRIIRLEVMDGALDVSIATLEFAQQLPSVKAVRISSRLVPDEMEELVKHVMSPRHPSATLSFLQMTTTRRPHPRSTPPPLLDCLTPCQHPTCGASRCRQQ